MKLTLKSKSHLLANVWSFVFEPSEPLTWIAGQFIRVELPHANPDAEGTRRFFTVASAPYERRIQISTRLTGTSFKRALEALEPGGNLNIVDPPAGDFVWTRSAAPLVFVAQGIGITPFRSILRQRAHDRRPLSAHLFYTNAGTSIPFQPELDALARNSELQITHLRRPVTPITLAGALPDLAARTVYVSGPHSLIGLLTPPHNLPAAQLRQDFFPGYTSENY
jgi:ferredoxin-NADP reductase